MITLEGSIPFPPGTNASAVTQMGTAMGRLAQALTGSAGSLSSSASAAQAGWKGSAATAFGAHVAGRVAAADSAATALARVPALTSAFALSIDAAEMAYSAAAAAEEVARAGLPWTAGAMAAAIAEEGVAVAALEGAGAVFTAGMVSVITRVGLQELRQLATTVGGEVARVAGRVEGLVSEGQQALGAVSSFLHDPLAALPAAAGAANTVTSTPGPGGTTTRTNAVGTGVQDALGRAGGSLQAMVAAAMLVTETPLTATDRPADDPLAGQLRAAGHQVVARTPAELGTNLAVLEATRRASGDQSLVLAHTLQHDGAHKVLTLEVSGIVAPGSTPASWGLGNPTGDRNVVAASASQIGHTGQEELALQRWIESQGLRPGDTVTLLGHSQGGIVSQNLAPLLVHDGFHVNVVAYGSPDQQEPPGVTTYLAQNTADPVPATRSTGDSGAGQTLLPGQHVLTFTLPPPSGNPLLAHDPLTYGPALSGSSGASTVPGASDLQAFLARQAALPLDSAGITTFAGAGTTGTWAAPQPISSHPAPPSPGR